MNYDGLLKCARDCMKKQKGCKKLDCRHHILYPMNYNCTLIAIFENGPMTLREVADRLEISFARVKQIEQKALGKLKKNTLLS